MATSKPGDRLMALPNEAAGHVSHHEEGAAGRYGLKVHPVPIDAHNMMIDLPELERRAKEVKPHVIIVGGSLFLYPLPLAEVRKVADSVGAYLIYDAAHVAGLIAGGKFQMPLAEGAHLVTMSTYKSFGGPPGGLILTNSAQLASRVAAIAYPGLTANFDLSKIAALAITALDIRANGQSYARTCISNAKRLALALHARGCPIYGARSRDFTESHHVAIVANAFGGGRTASLILEGANILTSGIPLPLDLLPHDTNGVRLGTQEVSRLKMKTEQMDEIAELICRVLLKQEAPDTVKHDTIRLRQQFKKPNPSC
jgi:glycine hydroxymethyltransferase